MTTQPIADLRSEAHRYSFHLGTEELIKRLPAPQSDQCGYLNTIQQTARLEQSAH